MANHHPDPDVETLLARISDRDALIARLARLVVGVGDAYLEKMSMLEGDDGALVYVHSATCDGSCDYGCSGLFVMYSRPEDEEDAPIEIEEVGDGSNRWRKPR